MEHQQTEVAYTPLDEIRPHPGNPKQHDVGLIVGSLRRFGFLDPVVVDQRTGLLVSGHGRCEALRTMRDGGEEPPSGINPDGWRVPVYVGWSSRDDDEAAAALVALNRSTEAGGWDDSALRNILDRLDEIGRLDGVGYSEREIERLRDRLDHVDPPPAQQTFSLELMERQDFVVLLFDNEMDWHTAQVRLGLGPVHGPDSRDGYERKGLGRVVNGRAVIEALPPEGIGGAYAPLDAEEADRG
ncbi:hypothetical protein [Aquisalimonas sp.]|uniref:hypothetical protein n=1 Tax=Aquisalimonas sp. TaxID=1872621 RepID=UPI0025B7F47F|nr:hypothetical protein [Aquisalimonas sp.]